MLLEEGILTREGLLTQLGLSAGDCEKLCSLPEGFFSMGESVTQLARVRLKASSTAQPAEVGRVLEFGHRKV